MSDKFTETPHFERYVDETYQRVMQASNSRFGLDMLRGRLAGMYDRGRQEGYREAHDDMDKLPRKAPKRKVVGTHAVLHGDTWQVLLIWSDGSVETQTERVRACNESRTEEG